MSGWSDIWTLITSTAQDIGGNPANVASQINEPGTLGSDLAAGSGTISGAESFWGALTAFLTALADWHMWASLGWLLLGLGLMYAGARLWMGKPPLASPVPLPVPV